MSSTPKTMKTVSMMATVKNGEIYEFGEVVATPVGLISYPKVWEPVMNDLNNKMEFQCSILINKDKADMSALRDESLRVARLAIRSDIKSLSELGDRCPIKDGDKRENGDPANGHWVLPASCNADHKPRVLDAKKFPISDHSEIYGGAIGLMFVQPMAYVNRFGKGVKLMLKGIQKIADGKPFGQAQFDPDASGFQTPSIPDYLRGHVQERRSYVPPAVATPSNGRTAADNALIAELKGGFAAVEVTGDSDKIPF